jgi:predicted nucleic acid-binding protein
VIVCDTGPLVAAALSNDSDHKACVELTDVATLDRRHFTVVRPGHVDALTLLP